MSALTDLLERHAPYASKRVDNTLCLICLDAGGHGEFPTITEWAEHVEAELRAAGLKVTRRAAVADDQTEAML
jgi:hypothetical protein